MGKPLITIGITSFNSSSTITRAVNSALKQFWRPIEIIIVDDFSNDGAYKLIKNMEKDFSEIKVFRNNNNEGVAFSRNKIIQNAKGEFLVFFDDDDESLPNRIDEQYLRIIDYEKNFANGSPVICHSARKLIYKNKFNLIENTMGENEYIKAPRGHNVVKRILYGNPLKGGYGSLATCSQMARLDTYKLVGGFDNNFRRSEDTELSVRLALKGTHFVGIKKVLVIQNMTKTKEKNYEDELIFFKMVIKKHKELMNNKNYEFALKWIDLKYIAYSFNLKKFIICLIFMISKYPILSINRLFFSFKNIIRNLYFFNFHKKE